MYSLILERMSEVDFGEYLCEARNSLGSGKAHLQISGKEDRTENRLSGGNAKIFQTRRTEQRRRIGEGGLG